jgi:hypothetical protein
MNRKSLKTGRKEGGETLTALLAINCQYNQLLQTLAQNNSQAAERSPQAYLFETLQNIKQLNSCMKQELKQYHHLCSPALE